MTLGRALVVLLLCVAPSTSRAAELPPSEKTQIEQLLAGLGASSCEFYRNGSWYGASDAAAHLRKKYDYLARKRMIASAEDFIVGAATKSSQSGDAYQVRCANEPAQPSATWMRRELARLREAPPKPGGP
jgi:hypothetical protein